MKQENFQAQIDYYKTESARLKKELKLNNEWIAFFKNEVKKIEHKENKENNDDEEVLDKEISEVVKKLFAKGKNSFNFIK